MATLAVQSIIRAGLVQTYAAATSGGDEFVNTGAEYVEIINGSAATIVVTIDTPNTVDGLAIADRVISILAGETRKIGPFPTATYNDSAAKVQITYDGVTTLTIGVFALS